jgi:2-succinyl-5-enolpyruvyl-6-hydroxy-3-cyclohexene-1-carboxylate synthase
MADPLRTRRASAGGGAALVSKPAGGGRRPAETTAATGALNLAWAEAFVTALEDAGVRDACVCPGSRSAPLTLALHRSSIRTHVALDERAGAFFALGLAKASRRPVLLVCTSGTAAANFHPAVLEARHGRVPLVIATADRPPELRDAGAAQTIDQIRLYGDAVRWFSEVGTPDALPDLLRYVASLGTRAAATAWGPPAGPVHLNFAFREPLLPEPDALAATPEAGRERPAGRAEREAGPRDVPPSRRDVSAAVRAMRTTRRGLIVCGPEDAAPEFAAAVARLADVTGFPILADPASQVRYGPHDTSRVLGGYDAFLRSASFASREVPEVVLQFGAPLASRAFQAYVARHPDTAHYVVDRAGEWRSPARRASAVFTSDPTAFALALVEALATGADPLPSWAEAFGRAELATRRALERHRADPRGAAGTPYVEIFDALPEGAILYVGNSMAIRDLDLFVPSSPKRIRVLAHRGVNGIDGLVSASLGAAAAGTAPVLLVTGDLSFHHDLNGLWASRAGGPGATIVIVNDDGGGIFSLLPVARHRDAFERFFGTPHGLDFAHAAALYGVAYSRPDGAAALTEAVARAISDGATEMIEIRADRETAAARHQAIWSDVVDTVEEEG